MLCETDDPSTGQLRLFAVEKSRRRQGIGRALMEALLAKAQEAGYKTLILWTAGPLEAAIRQYERFGFRVVETSENRTWRPDGEPVVEIKMEKDARGLSLRPRRIGLPSRSAPEPFGGSGVLFGEAALWSAVFSFGRACARRSDRLDERLRSRSGRPHHRGKWRRGGWRCGDCDWV